ncbi:hypothetical protein [Treponema sp.]|uniref:hypothetical protein n=1 Tax=Treponema sp. TaxID=166 RepID=UPI0025D736ED|nr:hypothetical protein [Treponema sp.]MCR5218737.1 hypothetical protein [Treponema sp.]
MKKIAVLVLACAAVFFSCSKKSDSAKKAEKPSVQGVMLYETSHYWKETDEGKMRWVDSIGKGDVVKIYTDASGNPETKKAVREGKTEEETFYHINIEELGDYWTIDWYLAPNASPAAILEECFIFTEPKNAAATSNKLSKFEIVGVVGEEENFYKIYVRDNVKLRQNVYVEKKYVCNHANDVEAFKTYRRIPKSEGSTTVQTEVLNMLIKDYALTSNTPRLCAEAYKALALQMLTDEASYAIDLDYEDAMEIDSILRDLYDSSLNSESSFEDEDEDEDDGYYDYEGDLDEDMDSDDEYYEDASDDSDEYDVDFDSDEEYEYDDEEYEYDDEDIEY